MYFSYVSHVLVTCKPCYIKEMSVHISACLSTSQVGQNQHTMKATLTKSKETVEGFSETLQSTSARVEEVCGQITALLQMCTE